jgi:unsaturated rhamnogalacturonyl hydrolase
MEYNKILNHYIGQLLAESTPEAPVWNREQFVHNKGADWNYVNGITMRALLNLYSNTGEDTYLNFVDNFMDYFVDVDGNIKTYKLTDYNIDHLCGGPVLLTLYEITGKEKYIKAAKGLRQQLTTQPRTKEGNFWHKKIYPNQVWLDGLYMGQPFYMEYEEKYNQAAGCPDSFKQFMNAGRLMKDTVTGLYYHGYDESRESFWCDKSTGLSKGFWLRALGWFVMALVDTMEVMPKTMEAEKEKLLILYQDLIEALLKYQDIDSRMWYQVIDQGGREGNYLETSGSAILSYAILKSVRLSYLKPSYREIGEQIFYGICNKYLSEENGKLQLGGICLVAGLGGNGTRRDGSYEYYISEPVVENDGKGVAPLLLAYSELLRG